MYRARNLPLSVPRSDHDRAGTNSVDIVRPTLQRVDTSGACMDPAYRQPADFSLMSSSTASGRVDSKSSSLTQVGVIVMTTISS